MPAIFDVLAAVLSLFVGLLLPFLENSNIWEDLRTLLVRLNILPSNKRTIISYQEKMTSLIAALTQASSEMDDVLSEITSVVSEREERLQELTKHLNELSQRETDLTNKISALEQIPIPAMEYFLEATKKGEQRSAIRDYLLFAAGVIVSLIFTLLFGS